MENRIIAVSNGQMGLGYGQRIDKEMLTGMGCRA